MNEKEIIKSKQYNVAILRNVLYIISVLATIVWAVVYTIPVYARKVRYWHADKVYFLAVHILVPLLPLVIIGTIIYFITSKIEITVTDKRVYGTALFGKRVDLPLDKIAAVGTSAFKGVAVTTSSGAIKFVFIKNNYEIHKAISNLLIQRQDNAASKNVIIQESNNSNADELKKFKELLDQGIISQEEFDAKKKQLLGL